MFTGMNIVNETEGQAGLALVYGIAALNTYPVSSKDHPVLLRRDARNGTVAAGLTCADVYCTHVCGQESKVDATWRHVCADASHSGTAPQPSRAQSCNCSCCASTSAQLSREASADHIESFLSNRCKLTCFYGQSTSKPVIQCLLDHLFAWRFILQKSFRQGTMPRI